MKKVIIIGGGFRGINCAKYLNKSEFEVLLIDKTNHHLFQPLLYQVASAALSPGNIAVPIREILRYQKNTSVIMGEVISIDKMKKEVTLTCGRAYSYDILVIATGTRHSYFGHPEWEALAPGIKNLNDAINIRENILLAFEKAERIQNDPEEVKSLLRFVIIGGGPTGVEMAGAIAEIAHQSLFRNFRHIQPEHSEIYLIEGAPRLLTAYPEHLSEIAKQDLEKMGVKVITGHQVTAINEKGISFNGSHLPTQNIIWAAGNQASSLLKTLDVPLDKQGRVIVNPDLTIPDHPEIFVIGDAADAKDPAGASYPGIAPVAIQQGMHVAKMKHSPFVYNDKGSIATIGKAKAVGMFKKRPISGFSAWLLWSLVHIFYLISFGNRFIVMTQWFLWYLTGGRYVRLIRRPID